MNSAEVTTIGPTIALAWKRRVDHICERFEDAWAEGASPRVEDYLNDPETPTSRHSALLAELLKLERELRQKRGEKPGASEYLARFPSYPVVVRSVFGDDQVGDYDLISPIGEGGMGVVYLARHRKIGREVALKMIRSYCLDDASAVDRFRLEAQLAARLDHENIVTVYEAGLADGQHFYAMKHIVGQSLSEIIGRKPMDTARAARIIEQVARAVDYAHTHDVLHRDIKPRNILMDAADRAFVTDFGLAKALNHAGTGATRTDERLGTPPYMAPEQVRDPSRAGVASDVYSLGATLYECLTGWPPFHGDNPLEVCRQVLDVEPTPPRTRNSRCPRDLETICLKCLEKDPARRYVSALAMAEDLRRFRDHLPIKARRVGLLERVAKWGRKHPTAAALIAVTYVAVVALFAVVQTRRANAIIEKSYEQARATVDAFTQFGEVHLADQPAKQKELLEIARRYYDEFLVQRGHDPTIAEDLANTHTSVARLNIALNARSGALEAYERSLALRRDLVKRSPRESRLRAALADTLHEVGILQRAIGRRDLSILSFREALALREALVEADPDCRAFLHDAPGATPSPSDRALIGDLARSHGYIGDWERESGLRDAARRSYAEAQSLRARLASSDPSDLIAKFQLARSENNAGILEREDHQYDKAIKSQKRALALQEELVSVPPDQARSRLDEAFRLSGKTPDLDPDDFRTDLATTWNYLGILYEESEQPVEALAAHEAAEKLLDALATEHPGVPKWDADRGLILTYLGELRRLPSDLEAGRRIFDRLLKEDPNAPRLRSGLARNLYASGLLHPRDEGTPRLHDAEKIQRELVAEQPENFDFRRDLERTRAAITRLDRSPQSGK